MQAVIFTDSNMSVNVELTPNGQADMHAAVMASSILAGMGASWSDDRDTVEALIASGKYADAVDHFNYALSAECSIRVADTVDVAPLDPFAQFQACAADADLSDRAVIRHAMRHFNAPFKDRAHRRQRHAYLRDVLTAYHRLSGEHCETIRL